ncbi:MAG: hypothetical protein IPL71_20660 [Anaerolineales bacterium]|nr:hypothetical protein [Anaerolineales bacterium]
MYEVWHDHQFKDEPRYTSDLYPFFLRLMEKYDVSYRLPEERKASLVAQHVPRYDPNCRGNRKRNASRLTPHRHGLRDGRRPARLGSVDDRPHA